MDNLDQNLRPAMTPLIANQNLERACSELDVDGVAQALTDGACASGVDDEQTPMMVLAVNSECEDEDRYSRIGAICSALIKAGASPDALCAPAQDEMERGGLEFLVSRMLHECLDKRQQQQALSTMSGLLEHGANPAPETLGHNGLGDLIDDMIRIKQEHPDLNDPDCAQEGFDRGRFLNLYCDMVIMLGSHGAPRVGERLARMRLPEERCARISAALLECSMAENTPDAAPAKPARRFGF